MGQKLSAQRTISWVIAASLPYFEFGWESVSNQTYMRQIQLDDWLLLL